MAFYAFALEPPLPRTEFVDVPEDEGGGCGDGSMSVFERAVVNVLMAFPDAYRAVAEEVNRLREKLRPSP
jgi:hypothetical protein